MVLKILHVALFFHGGVGKVALNLTKAFTRMGCEVILATSVRTPNELRELIKHYYVLYILSLREPFYSLQFYILNRERIRNIVRLEKPDVILTHGPLALIAKDVYDVPLVSIVHGTYANEVRWMWSHPIFSFERTRYVTGIYATHRLDTMIYRYVAKLDNVHLVAVSKNTKRELVEAGVQGNKVFPILNGVDKDMFKPMNKDYAKALVEEMFKIRLGNKVLLHVNPGSRKGTHILVKAVAMLKKIYGNDFTLLIVGRLDHKTYREYIENMIRELKLEDNIRFLGFVENEKLPVLYNAADLTVVPSYSEGAPLVIPESLACGTPVVATNVGGNAEYLKMAGLKDYLVNITEYDFHGELYAKILSALDGGTKIQSNNVPSWNDIGTKYLEKFFKICC